MAPDVNDLATSYAYAAECQLDTLSEVCYKKKTARWEITRHRDITFHMLLVCKTHHDQISWDRGLVYMYGRVEILLRLDREKPAGTTLHDILNDYVRRCMRRDDDPKDKRYRKWLKSWEKDQELKHNVM